MLAQQQGLEERMDKDECVDAELARLRRENGELRALCEQQRRYIDACQARGGDPAAEEDEFLAAPCHAPADVT